MKTLYINIISSLKRIFVMMLFCFLNSNILAASLPQAKSFRIIDDIKINNQDNLLNISVVFNSSIPSTDIKVIDYDTFLQINIPNTLVVESGKFFDIDTFIIKKMAIFQNTPLEVAIRLFVERGASELKEQLRLNFFDNEMVISFDLAKLRATLEAINVNNVNQVAENVELSINTAAKENNTVKNNTIIFKDTSVIKNKMIMIAVLSVMLLLILPIFYLYKIFFRKATKSLAEDSLTKIKVVSSCILAPRHKLTLVEVAGQRFLLGVSADNINYLTKIDTDVASQRVMLSDNVSTHKSRLAANVKYIPQNAKKVFDNKDMLNNSVSKNQAVRSYLSSAKEYKNQNKSFDRYMVDDDMQSKNNKPISNEKNNISKANDKVISDVTKIIREKLRQLPPI